MMRAILFDLGDTLVDAQNHPLPGAIDLLTALRNLHDPEGKPMLSGLISDWEMSQDPAQRDLLRQEYLAELQQSGLDVFFQPANKRVTLSTDVGVFKPDPLIFKTALECLAPGLPFHHAVFVTERLAHIKAARALGLMAIHLKGPGQATGEVDTLADLLPLLQRLLAFSPCCKKHSEAVGLHASVANKRKRTDAAVSALVARVSATRLRDRIRHLSDFGTRWTYSANIAQVPLWVRDRLLEMGYPQSQVRFQAFDVPGAGQQNNVLCGPGAGHPGFVLVCAHYDSLSETPAVKAPGADDNASGLAVLLLE
jgi:FMN phosphatase YigB (HAD superfamily)